MKKKEKNMFAKPGKKIDFFSSGCVLLDCVLGKGKGWAERRISHIAGDSSAGKTQLAEEAAINFLLKYNTGKIIYHETESAFDFDYAETIGLPIDMVKFVEGKDKKPINTVEGFKEEVIKYIQKSMEGVPIIYILDSLDSLSGGAVYGEKQKELSSMFRELSADVARSNLHLMIIGQTRVNMGNIFQKDYITGGEALKFYSSQRVLLHDRGKVKRTYHGIERIIGVKTNAYCFKNKVAPPYRSCDFEIIFYYGVNDVGASLNWINSNKDAVTIFEEIGIGESIFNEVKKENSEEVTKVVSPQKLGNFITKFNEDQDSKIKDVIDNRVRDLWNKIEDEVAPSTSKYSI